MPAAKRWPHERGVKFSDEQWQAVNALAEARQTSFSAVVRELIDAGLAVKSAQATCLHCPSHCPHNEVQPS